MGTPISKAAGGRGIEPLKSLDKKDALHVLEELQTNLRRADGSNKSGVLRLMHASSGKTNEGRELRFERKSWWQLSRWGKDSSQRTRQAIEQLFDNAKLTPQARQALDKYFETHKRISAGSLAKILDQYLPMPKIQVDAEDTLDLLNGRIAEAQKERDKPLDQHNSVSLPLRQGAQTYQVPGQFILDVPQRGGMVFRDGQLHVSNVNPGHSVPTNLQAMAQFLDQHMGWQMTAEQKANFCYNLSSMVGQFIHRDMVASIDEPARQAAARFRPDMAQDLAMTATHPGEKGSTLDSQRLHQLTSMSVWKDRDGISHLGVHLRLTGPLSFTTTEADASSQSVSSGLFLVQQRSISVPFYEMEQKNFSLQGASAQNGDLKIRPIPLRQAQLLDRLHQHKMALSAEQWVGQSARLRGQLDSLDDIQRPIVQADLLQRGHPEVLNLLKNECAKVDQGAFNPGLSDAERARRLDEAALKIVTRVNQDLQANLPDGLSESEHASALARIAEQGENLKNSLEHSIAACKDPQKLSAVTRFGQLMNMNATAPERTLAAYRAMQVFPSLGSAQSTDAPPELLALFEGKPLSEEQLSKLEPLAGTA